MNNKLISVIVPIYNVERYLSKCINSIINQTYKNIEIILVDDGSLDNCSSICDRYKEMDSRIVVIHKTNGGLSSARNTGLDIAKGELISFVDSDDYLENNFLEELKKNMDKYNSDISICDFYDLKDGKKIKHSIDKSEYVLKSRDKYINLFNENRMTYSLAWNKLYKRKLFNCIRYPNGKIFEDLYIICDLLDRATKISYIGKALYNYLIRENSISRKFTVDHLVCLELNDGMIKFFNKKKYYDFAYLEMEYKMISILGCLVNLKLYKINEVQLERTFYNELIDLNKKIKWNKSPMRIKTFKILRKNCIRLRLIQKKIILLLNNLKHSIQMKYKIRLLKNICNINYDRNSILDYSNLIIAKL